MQYVASIPRVMKVSAWTAVTDEKVGEGERIKGIILIGKKVLDWMAAGISIMQPQQCYN
jgi:hypothetical protein